MPTGFHGARGPHGQLPAVMAPLLAHEHACTPPALTHDVMVPHVLALLPTLVHAWAIWPPMALG